MRFVFICRAISWFQLPLLTLLMNCTSSSSSVLLVCVFAFKFLHLQYICCIYYVVGMQLIFVLQLYHNSTLLFICGKTI
ncbi:hypothetical protein QVD17_19809 [Tagetes erecta]|uniref:Uncharacterized protein n=1 Tax=Tagetes erecta TaxID=13708 RepID=A0AAD8KKL1_TARER|nr:hypothetical protein QVD17_19809 [Tagetes erecta]